MIAGRDKAALGQQRRDHAQHLGAQHTAASGQGALVNAADVGHLPAIFAAEGDDVVAGGCLDRVAAVETGLDPQWQQLNHVAITVRTNNAPTIAELIADVDWTTPAGSLQVTCIASDPDGDEMNYEWAATAGDISGTGAVVNWTAPQEVGTYEITVVVRDGHGWEDTRSVSLSVALGPPLTIENLIVTAKGHIYLIEVTPGYEYKVLRTAEYYIECITSDTNGGLVHEWSCDGGQITGGDSIITWTAPNTDIEVTVTVTVVVSDGVGNRVNKNLVFQVITCACAF